MNQPQTNPTRTAALAAAAILLWAMLWIIACDPLGSSPPACPEPPPCPACPDLAALLADAEPAGTTSFNNLKIGNGTPNVTLNGEDAYIEGTFEVDGAVRIDGAIDANSTMDIAGNLSDSDSAVTFADNVMIDGAADAVQLTVQGYQTQTSNILVVEGSNGTDAFWVDNNGDAELNGITPYLTIGDGGAEDAGLKLDGAASDDWNISVDDSASTLVLGHGTTAGTTDVMTFDTNRLATVSQDLQIVGGLTLGGSETAVSDGQTITPTNNYAVYNLSTTGAVTITLAACTTDGELVILAGDDANDIIIADSNIRTSTGSALTINQYDLAGFICIDTEWLELFLITDS